MSPLVLAWALAARAPEAAAPDAASDLEQQALDAYRRADLETASRLLASAHLLVPRPRYLYMRAVVESDRGQCGLVRHLVERYLETEPTEAEERDAERQVDRCIPAAEVATPAPTEVPTSVARAPTRKPGPPPPRLEPPRPSWRSDRAGIGLTASGGLVLATGLGLLGGALGVWQTADDGTADRYVERIALAKRLRTSAIVVASVGLALAIAGTARFVHVERRSRRGARASRHPSSSPASRSRAPAATIKVR